MTVQNYNINGLVEILIDPDVRPEVVREIDFQIGYFKSNASSIDGKLPRINIHPYSDWILNKSGENGKADFYTCSGMPGINIDDADNHLCIVRGLNEFTIYADYPNFLINLYIQLLIAPGGLCMIHAGGYVSSNGSVTLIAGAGGIGKTAIIGHAVREKGLKHLGDDIVILGKTAACFPFPRAFVLKSYHREMYSETFNRMKLPRWNLYKIKRFIIENAPFVGVGKSFLRRTGLYYSVADLLRPKSHLATVSPDDIFGFDSVAASGQLGCLLYLDRTDSDEFHTRTMSKEEMVNRLLSVIHYEWKDFISHLLSLGALNVIDLKSYFLQVIENLNESVNGRTLVYIHVPRDAGPERLVEYLNNQNLF